MDFNNYPEYAAIASHIRYARIERAVMIAHSIAGFVMNVVDAIKAPPAPAAIIIDRRLESRTGARRLAPR
jgi:hypothetical protein